MMKLIMSNMANENLVAFIGNEMGGVCQWAMSRLLFNHILRPNGAFRILRTLLRVAGVVIPFRTGSLEALWRCCAA